MPSVESILAFFASAVFIFTCVSAELVFIHCFYDKNFLWHKKKGIFILLAAIAEAAITYAFPTWVDLSGVAFYLIKFFLVMYDYRGKKFKGVLRFLLVSSVIEFSLLYIGIVGAYLMIPDFDFWSSDAFPVSVELFVNIVHTIFFGVIFLYLYFRVYKKGIIIKCGVREIVFAALYPLLCFIIPTLIIALGKESAITLLILSIMAVLLALFIPMFLYYMRIQQYYEQRSAHQENYMQTELAHFTQYKQSQEETARFRHDIRNYLLGLNSLLTSGKTDEATQYLQDMLSTAEELRQKYVSGDEMLDCIISVKATDMEKQNIPFSLDGVLAGGLGWKPMDICVVFANALDNAIEACANVPQENRHISMTIKSTAQYWFVSITNPVLKAVNTDRLFQQSGSFTTKSNSRQHGLGTYNMKRAVETNGGIIKAHSTDETFTLEIVIDKSNAQ